MPQTRDVHPDAANGPPRRHDWPLERLSTPQETSGANLHAPIPVEAHDVERLKTSFYRFLELRLGRLPQDGAVPEIRIRDGAATILGAEPDGEGDLAGEFAAYWRNRAPPALERDPVTARRRARWA